VALGAGVGIEHVAKQMGHSDTRMVEKHYGHLAPNYVADAFRAGFTSMGLVERPMSFRWTRRGTRIRLPVNDRGRSADAYWRPDLPGKARDPSAWAQHKAGYANQ
jgi:hypothetical protein